MLMKTQKKKLVNTRHNYRDIFHTVRHSDDTKWLKMQQYLRC